MYCCMMTLFTGGRRWTVVMFMEDDVFGGAWRVHRLLASGGDIGGIMHSSSFSTAAFDRMRMRRNLGRRGFEVEDLNGTLGAEVVLASDVIMELEDRGLLQWGDIEREAVNPGVLLEVRVLVSVYS